MIDREYVKLNSSIQTASNTDNLHYDDEGNIEATLELRLPDNLFEGSSVGKKIERVEMATTKFRLSMGKTPIAQLPVVPGSSNSESFVSDCQLDVYPFVRDNNSLALIDPQVFPDYKNHTVLFNFYLKHDNEEDPDLIDTVKCAVNVNGTDFPEDHPYYPFVKTTDLDRDVCHMMNLCGNRGPYNYQGDMVDIRDIDMLTRLLQDAIENAVTYASTSSNVLVKVYLIAQDLITPATNPRPDIEHSFTIPDLPHRPVCFWYYEEDETNSYNSCKLESAFKPSVQISDTSIKIGYDTAPFNELVPILWAPGYINTGYHPPQMTIDELRKEVWQQPPPKRIYKYGASVGQDATYAYTLDADMSCGVMNLIANQSFMQTFSFLPWIEANVEVTKMMIDGFKIIKEADRVTTTTPTTEYVYTGYKQNVYPLDLTFYAFTASGDPDYTNPEDPSEIVITHTYRLYLTNPALKQNQTVVWGTDTRAGSEYDFTISEFPIKTITGTPTISSDSEELYEYDSKSAPFGEGEYVLDSVPVDHHTTTPSTSLTGEEFWYATMYWEEVGEGEDRHREWVMGEYSYGGWTTGVYNRRFLPPREPDYKSYTYVFNQTDPTQSYNLWTERWIIPNIEHPYFARNDVSAYVRIMKKEYDDITTARNEKLVISKSEFEDYDYSRMPNLNCPDGKFYILDGTATEVGVSQPELIYDQMGSFKGKYQIDIVKHYTAHDANTTTVSMVANTNGTYPAHVGVIKTLYHLIPFITTEHHRVVLEETYYASDITGSWVFSDYKLILHNSANPRDDSKSYVYTEGTDEFKAFAVISETPGESPSPLPIPPDESKRSYSNDTHLTPGTVVIPGSSTTVSSREYTTGASGKRRYGFDIIHPADTSYNSASLYMLEDLSSSDISPDSEYPGKVPDSAPVYDTEIETLSEHQRRVTKRYLLKDPIQAALSAACNVYLVTGDVVTETQTVDEKEYTTTQTITELPQPRLRGNVRLDFTWNNLPMVVMSPITSIVLLLTGININNEIQPVNMTEKTGSSLVSTMPIVENFYSLANSLRDLHDEIVVVKDGFDDLATYTLETSAGKERVLHISAKYIAKDGSLHSIYIPPNGVFNIQFTFALSLYKL